MNGSLGGCIKVLLIYFLICFVSMILVAVVIEMGLIPIIAWLHGYDGYYFPPLSRAYAWCKLILFSSGVCALGAWLYGGRRFK